MPNPNILRRVLGFATLTPTYVNLHVGCAVRAEPLVTPRVEWRVVRALLMFL